MTRLGALFSLCALTVGFSPLSAQSYRVKIDASAQGVSFRGLARDSVAIGQTQAAPSGGLQTRDGYAARCGTTEYCVYSRPGPTLRSMPVASTLSVVMWGLGVRGLALHATGRMVADVGPDRAWPGTDPSGQLLEGYLEYQRAALLARAGRQLVASRLEPMGFDGGLLRLRAERLSVELTGYAGWGLGQAAVLPTTSPALNPLDEWRPRNRQLVTGAEGAWQDRYFDVRGEYRREIDPEDDYFVSERAALSIGARLASLRLSGGTDYNIAEGHLGNVDATITYANQHRSLAVGARRYRPYFSLWTLWGAFSPVPYTALFTSGQIRATSWLSVQGRAERYRYADADISTALVPELRNGGWRANLGATATLSPRWSAEGSYSVERGPGASGRFADGGLTFAPSDGYSLNVYGGTMARPLELRYYDATSRWLGGRIDRQLSASHRLWGDAAIVTDNRERPDAGANALSQLRLRAGFSLAFGSKADRLPLPPARRTGA